MELNTCSRNYKAIPNKKTIEWTENVSSRWLYSYRLHLWLFSLGENKGHTWLIKWDWTKVKIVEREKNVINNRPKSRGRLAQSMKHLFCKIFASSRLRLWQPTPGFISHEKLIKFCKYVWLWIFEKCGPNATYWSRNTVVKHNLLFWVKGISSPIKLALWQMLMSLLCNTTTTNPAIWWWH